MADEIITTEEQYYDLAKYREEIGQFIKGKRLSLDRTAQMQKTYLQLYRSACAGSTESKDERFGYLAEMAKVYKSALIESCLSGYSALLEISGDDAYSVLKSVQLKDVMTRQFKSMTLLEKLSGKLLEDWIFKGEAVGFFKLKENREKYRIRETLTDEVSGQPIMKFTMKEVLSHDTLEFVRIDPLDFFVDAMDYESDPRGCVKIIRSWISPKTLLTSNAYPLLSKDDKDALIAGVGRNGGRESSFISAVGNMFRPRSYSETSADRIEVLTFYGDYITNDNKVLSNIRVVTVGGYVADAKYSDVNTNRIVYASYLIDNETHRGIAPLAPTITINTLANRVADLYITNLDNTANPIMMYQKGSMSRQDAMNAIKTRQLEYNDIDSKPEWLAPPIANPNGMGLIQSILEQGKNVLGINNYLAGNTDGAVRTARESSILFQKANARMRVETDVFSYGFLLRLFVAFYAFNRELAFVADKPLDPIYQDTELRVSISTNASRADKEGEFRRLMEMLNLPIAQMIFSNLDPQQIMLAVRYLMAKAELTDADNLLELVGTEWVSDEQQQQQMQMQQQPPQALPPVQ